MSSKAIQKLLKFAQEYSEQYEDDGFDENIDTVILGKVESITRLLIDIKNSAEALNGLDDSDRKETLAIIGMSFGEIINDAGEVVDAVKGSEISIAQE